jgi:hypothetical protein
MMEDFHRGETRSGVQLCIMSFASAMKLSFVVVRVGERRANPDWTFMSIAQGRNRHRQISHEAVAAANERRVA